MSVVIGRMRRRIPPRDPTEPSPLGVAVRVLLLLSGLLLLGWGLGKGLGWALSEAVTFVLTVF